VGRTIGVSEEWNMSWRTTEVDHSSPAASACVAGRPRHANGFDKPGNASAAARKGQAMGLCRRWTAQEARAYAAVAGRASVAKRPADDQRLVHARAEAQRKREMVP
jgi:hypothetical protein